MVIKTLHGLIFGVGAGCLTLALMPAAGEHATSLAFAGLVLMGLEIMRWTQLKKNSDQKS